MEWMAAGERERDCKYTYAYKICKYGDHSNVTPWPEKRRVVVVAVKKGETVMSGATQFKWAFGNTVEMAKIQVKIAKPLNCELYKEQDHFL